MNRNERKRVLGFREKAGALRGMERKVFPELGIRSLQVLRDMREQQLSLPHTEHTRKTHGCPSPGSTAGPAQDEAGGRVHRVESGGSQGAGAHAGRRLHLGPFCLKEGCCWGPARAPLRAGAAGRVCDPKDAGQSPLAPQVWGRQL